MKSRIILLLILCLSPLALQAADWPQWQGPNRDNISKETGLLKDWTTKKPKLLWTFDQAGAGYSAPAIVGDHVYVLGTEGGKDQVFALSAKTGKKEWATEIGPVREDPFGDGPRSTPTVDGDHIYALGGQGILICVETATGKKVWSKDLPKDLEGKVMMRWGWCESPLVEGDHVVCSPGGVKGTLAALNKKTGDVIWRSTELKDEASYCSMIPIDFGGVHQYVQMTPEGVVGVAAKDGKLLWKVAAGANKIATITTPIYHDSYIYVTSSYNIGCAVVKLNLVGGKIEAEKVYENKKFIENHHGGVVLLDGLVYGCSGNSNAHKIEWVCQDLKTGDKKWGDKSFDQPGAITYADGRLYCYGQDDGTIVLEEPNATGWKEHGKFTIPQTSKLPRKSGKIWTHPVVANGKLYLRDEELIFCYDVSDK